MYRIGLIVAITLAVLAQAVLSSLWIAGENYGSQGLAAFDGKDYDAAARLFARARQAQPYEARWAYFEGLAVQRTEGPEAALRLFETAVEHAPHNPSTLITSAEAHAMAGETAAANDLLDRAAQINPYDWKLEHVRGLVAALGNRHDEAVRHLQAAYEFAEVPPLPLLSLLANELFAAGDYARAAARSAEAVWRQPQAPEHHLIRGKALFELGRFEEALSSVRTAEEEYSRRVGRGAPVAILLSEAWRYEAESLARLDRVEEGLTAIATLRAMGDDRHIRDAAVSLASFVLDESGAIPEPLTVAVADMLVDVGEVVLAERLLARHGDAESEDWTLIRVRLMAETGEPDAALDVLTTLPRAIANGPRGRLALGEIHAAAGRPASARLELRSLFPTASVPGHVPRQAQRVIERLDGQ